MKIIKTLASLTFLAFAAGCGGGNMNTGGGGNGGGGGSNSTPATVTVSSTKGAAFSVAMSTSFQPAEWDYTFFQQNPSATTPLGNLNPHHIRLQGVSQGVPQGSAGSNSTAWNFSDLDAIVQPVLGVGDHSPEFQIAKAPPFMYANNNSSDTFTDLTFAPFAVYAQQLVEYYNTGGFTANGQTYVSAAYPTDKITWWGIYNEPSINNNLTPAQYTTMYNALVPAMVSVDPSIKFVAMELCCGSEGWVQTFAQNVDASAPVNAVGTHYYSSCNQKDTDAMLLDTVPGFVSSVQTIYTNLGTNAQLASVPVWVTENNVNADYDAGNGMSACNPGQTFVTDDRGSSPFFAGWRPYVFSQLGQAGVQALYHWDFAADQQFGEVNSNGASLQLSYWVDYELGLIFPPVAGSQVLGHTSSDTSDLETLPVINSDGSVVVMVANHAVANPSTDNNGPGVPFSVTVDVSALGSFSSASLLIIDKSTNVASGPTASSITPAPKITMALNGYSVGFLALKP